MLPFRVIDFGGNLNDLDAFELSVADVKGYGGGKAAVADRHFHQNVYAFAVVVLDPVLVRRDDVTVVTDIFDSQRHFYFRRVRKYSGKRQHRDSAVGVAPVNAEILTQSNDQSVIPFTFVVGKLAHSRLGSVKRDTLQRRVVYNYIGISGKALAARRIVYRQRIQSARSGRYLAE